MIGEDWLAAVARIRRAGAPLRSPDMVPLYELAVQDGEAMLARRYRDIRPDERRLRQHGR